MGKGSKELKIGVAFIISLFILYFGISFLKGVNIFKPSNSFVVVFDDVSGLTKSAPVTLNGMQVGLVYSFSLDPNNNHRVATIVNMDKDVKIPVGSEFIMDSPILGSPNITLKLNYDENNCYTNTDTIIGIRKKDLMDAAGDVLPQVTQLIPKMDSLLININTLVSDPNISGTMANVNEITSDLTKSTKHLNSMLVSLNKDVPVITGNMAKVSNDLKSMDLKSTYQSIDATLKNIQYLSDQLKSKNGTVGLLLNDRQLYDSLNSTLNNASKLLQDVKENPSRYINVKVF